MVRGHIKRLQDLYGSAKTLIIVSVFMKLVQPINFECGLRTGVFNHINTQKTYKGCLSFVLDMKNEVTPHHFPLPLPSILLTRVMYSSYY